MFRNTFMKMVGVCKAEWFVIIGKKARAQTRLSLRHNFRKIITQNNNLFNVAYSLLSFLFFFLPNLLQR